MRSRWKNPAQLELFAEPVRVSIRSRALLAINLAPAFQSAAQIATNSGLTYRQTIDALNALHNIERICRQGHKFTARWGSLALARPDPTTAAALRLQDFFHATLATV